jgi:hypothetical protein
LSLISRSRLRLLPAALLTAALLVSGTMVATGSSFAAKSHTAHSKQKAHKKHKSHKTHTAITRVSAIGDTYVDQSHPRTNYVRAPILRVAARPQRRALIRFWLPKLTGQKRSVAIRAFSSRTRHQPLVVHATSCRYDNARVTWKSRPRMGARLAVRRKAIGHRYNVWVLPKRAVPAKGGRVCFYITARGKAPVNLGSWNHDVSTRPVTSAQTPTAAPTQTSAQLEVTTTVPQLTVTTTAPAAAPVKPAPSAPAPAPSTGTGSAAADMGPNAGLKPTKFISPSGSDSNGCTQSAPCRSITRADQVAQPGDVVSIADGTYDGGVLTHAGTASAPITYVAQNRWAASFHSLLDVRGAYVDVRNIDITGATAGGLALNGSYDRAIRNHIHDLPIPCNGTATAMWAGNGNDQPSYGTHDQQILYNVVNDIGTPGWTPSNCQLTHGIYVSVPNVKIVGNLVYHVIGDGIESWHAATRMTVVNNTVVGSGADGILLGNGDGGGSSTGNTGSYVANNITVNNYGHGITESGSASGNTYRDNLTFGNRWDCVSCSATSATESGTISADPKFVGNNDYHLQAGSPAVDSGLADNAPASDIYGDPRPMGGGIDRGAVER